MTEDEVLERIDALLRPLGCRVAEGDEYEDPRLDVLRYYCREERMARVPVVGRGLSVVVVARQPGDLPASQLNGLLSRVAAAAAGRFPPWPRGIGFTLGLSVVVLTPEPIRPDEESRLQQALDGPALRRRRVVPLGLFRLNPGQGALSMAIRPGPPGLFGEVAVLADGLGAEFGRYLPLLPEE